VKIMDLNIYGTIIPILAFIISLIIIFILLKIAIKLVPAFIIAGITWVLSQDFKLATFIFLLVAAVIIAKRS